MTNAQVAELRKVHAEITEDDDGECGLMRKVREAADTIERQAAEIGRLRDALARALLSAPGWQTIDSAPRDRDIIVWCPEREGLQAMASMCRWHPDAGFCVDELREPVAWMPPPVSPASPSQPEDP